MKGSSGFIFTSKLVWVLIQRVKSQVATIQRKKFELQDIV